MTTTLSKSDFKIAQTCPTKLFYKKMGYASVTDQDEYLELLAEGGFMVEKIAKLLYPEGQEIDFESDHAVAAQNTLTALNAHEVTLFEATFITGGKLARVDILIKAALEFKLIEVKAKSYDSRENDSAIAEGRRNVFWTKRTQTISSEWREYLEDITFQVHVLREVFPEATVVPFLAMPDKSKTTDIDRLYSQFSLERIQKPGSAFARVSVDFQGDATALRKNHFLTVVPVAYEVENLMDSVKKSAKQFSSSLAPKLQKIVQPIGVGCKDCEYRSPSRDKPSGFNECWGDIADVSPHLLDLYHVGEVGGRNTPLANALIKQRKAGLLDVPTELLVNAYDKIGEINKRQRIQIENTRSGTEWFSGELPGILSKFAYPLRFIDFETSALAVPFFAGMRPYEQIAFQWSCHVLDTPQSEPRHFEWINVVDAFPNFEFAESLMECVGEGGTVFMWATHENTILNNIHRQMKIRLYDNPTLATWLNGIMKVDKDNLGRLVDMNRMTLKHYFHPLMKGRTSIKKVCDAIWKTNRTLRSSFPEFLKEQGCEILSPYEALPPLLMNGQTVVVAEGTGAGHSRRA